ncbi:MAG: DoxX family protein [Chitinophagaceae bacterium]
MRWLNSFTLLRLTVAFILIMHSVPGMFNGGIETFGKLYLDAKGFAPLGIYIAWAIKLSHVVAALCLLINRYVRLAAWVTIFILISGIVMVHALEGWYVVGGGRNGVEFNILLIAVLLFVAYPGGFVARSTTQ